VITKTPLEKYLAGEPLNDELAALRAGIHEEFKAPAAPAWDPRLPAAEDDDKPLSKAERQALREGRQVGAFTTLARLLRIRLRLHVRQATIDSEKDPLARSSEIAQVWAYISIYRALAAEIEAMIQKEIEELEKSERGQ
jgi:hypothetical protein